MARKGSPAYYLQSKTCNKHWTQFELDLIKCIRDDHPIIYQDVGYMMERTIKRKCEEAWRKIALRFHDLDEAVLMTQWQAIRSNYNRARAYELTPQRENKYVDGTLDFLKSVSRISARNMKKKLAGAAEATTSTTEPSIRSLIHEEVDLDDDDWNAIKLEPMDDDFEEEAHNEVQESETLSNSDEEKLLNATILTQEMIKALIHIKTKQYFTEPASTTLN